MSQVQSIVIIANANSHKSNSNRSKKYLMPLFLDIKLTVDALPSNSYNDIFSQLVPIMREALNKC